MNMNSTEVKNRLLKQYPYRIELHAHTSPVSHCSEISPREMIETYVSKGYDAVVITNHFTPKFFEKGSKEENLDRYISDYEETLRISKDFPIKVFLGAEIRFSENLNEYLLYGVDRKILSVCCDYLDKGVSQYRKEVKLPKSVFIQAHPFRDGMTLCDPSLIDGIESFNMHPGHNSRIGLAVRYAGENSFNIKTAGSDFHHPNRGHEAVSALRTSIIPQDSFGIADILKSRDYILELGENSIVLP